MPRRASVLPFSVALCVLTAAPAAAQQAPAAGGQPIRQASASADAKPPRPQPQTLEVSEDLEIVLRAWGRQSAGIKRLTGTHKRIEYRRTVGTETHGNGEFAFESPDKGMIQIIGTKVPAGAVNQKIKDPNGNPLRQISAMPEKWVCDGAAILQMKVELGEKQYSRIEIPPSMRGENIIEGPLPFLFGVSGEVLKQRYAMQLGGKHTWQPGTRGGVVHVVAYPRRPQDARNWQKADVLLDGTTFLPTAIQLFHGRDQFADRTVYMFDQSTMKPNAIKWPWANPFKPSLIGWKMIENYKADEEQMRRMLPEK